jgi:hypothetical protein
MDLFFASFEHPTPPARPGCTILEQIALARNRQARNRQAWNPEERVA